MTGPDAGPVLVVGSYPPVATAGAAVTLAEVRRLLGAGRAVVVASPRPSAARYAVAVTGPLAGRRLRRLAGLTGASDLVVCAEADLPVPVAAPLPAALPLLQRRSVEAFVAAAASFDSFTLVLAGDLGLPARLLDRLTDAADLVVDHRGGTGTPGVTVLGPGAHSPAAAGRAGAGKVVRRALAPLPAPVRDRVATALRAVRDRLPAG